MKTLKQEQEALCLSVKVRGWYYCVAHQLIQEVNYKFTEMSTLHSLLSFLLGFCLPWHWLRKKCHLRRFPKSLCVKEESMPPISRIGKCQILQMFYPTAIYPAQGERHLSPMRSESCFLVRQCRYNYQYFLQLYWFQSWHCLISSCVWPGKGSDPIRITL